MTLRIALLSMTLAGCSEYGFNAGHHADAPLDETEPGPPVDTTPPHDTGTPPDPATCPDIVPSDYTTPDEVACERDPVVGSFDPVVEWTWTDNPIHGGYDNIMAAPVVANLTDDNGDGSIDAGDVPDVLFTAFANGAYTSPGALVAISGDDGRTLWSVTETQGISPYSSSGIAVADLEGDGEPEVLVSSTGGLLCLSHQGGFLWVAPVTTSAYGNPAVGDLDADGVAEIVYGNSVIDAWGTTLWTMSEGSGGGAYLSVPVDLDDDGLLEVVLGNAVYEHDGTLRWYDGGSDGFPAVGDLDLDGTPEVIRVAGSTVYALSVDGVLLWTFPITDGGGGPPTVADFDGDGAPEVGVASREVYRVIDGDGTQLWQNTVQDYSSSFTGSSVFDFEGDGAAEVVYADEETLWVYDGATGAVEMAWDSHSSGTLYEYPLIVDIDRDGAAEIVVASNDYSSYNDSRGITVIGDKASSWAPARPVWNQHAYHITHVEADGGVPISPIPNWTEWNSFRAGNSETAVGLALPELRPGDPTVCTDECWADIVVTHLAIENLGTSDTFAPISVSVFAVDGAHETLVDTQVLKTIPKGTGTWIGPLVLSRADFGTDGLIIRVDDDGSGGSAVHECDETNNTWQWARFPCDG